MKQLWITNCLRERMLQHITSCLPEEGCGIVGGLENRAQVILPITNQLHSSTKYLMDPKEQLIAFLKMEALNLKLLAFYHSHPIGPKTPSETDIREFFYPGSFSIIWYLSEVGWQALGFEIYESCYHEIELIWRPS